MSKRRQHGFTLLEILVALFVVATIGFAANAVLTAVLDKDSESELQFEQLQQLQRAMLVIERDFQQAVPRPIRVQGENNQIVLSGGLNNFESDADGVGFVRSGWSNPQLILPRSTLQGVAYRVQDGQLQRVYSNYVDNVVGAEPKVRPLIDSVEDFQVSYLLINEDGDTSWEDDYTGINLPDAIRLEIDTISFGLIVREFAMYKDS